MNDWLKPNQEEKIIKNCVESIMEDLDDYYFDEKLMKQYQKQLIEFFTKISKEYSLFKIGFDFSNKKNIVNDKEKIEEIKKMFDELEISFDAIQDTKDRDHTQVAYDIQKIKKILTS